MPSLALTADLSATPVERMDMSTPSIVARRRHRDVTDSSMKRPAHTRELVPGSGTPDVCGGDDAAPLCDPCRGRIDAAASPDAPPAADLSSSRRMGFADPVSSSTMSAAASGGERRMVRTRRRKARASACARAVECRMRASDCRGRCWTVVPAASDSLMMRISFSAASESESE